MTSLPLDRTIAAADPACLAIQGEAGRGLSGRAWVLRLASVAVAVCAVILVLGAGSAGAALTPSAPVIGSESVANVSTGGATFNAEVFPAGLDTTCTFEYVDDGTFLGSGYTNATSVPCSPADLGSSITAFQGASAAVTGLTPGTTYHFRVVATNSDGKVRGSDQTFKTPGPPVVSSETATNVTDVAATANATVNPTGLDTTCTFQYVDDATFQASGYGSAASVSCGDLGSSFGHTFAQASISGLTPGTLYHFRVVVTNSAGTTDGGDTTFRTPVSFLRPVSTFGGQGSAGGQFTTPEGMAVDQSTGDVFVSDKANSRVEKFTASGRFLAAWGWGVRDGAAHFEVCTVAPQCRAGIDGSGPGQFSGPQQPEIPSTIVVDDTTSSSAGDVYVGDSANNVVDKFDPSGHLLAVITGAGTPQGPFVSLGGITLDQSGNLWTADRLTFNVVEFDPTGKFLRQWSDPNGFPRGIAVDSIDGSVFLITQDGLTRRFTLSGQGGRVIDFDNASALAFDPSTGNLYIDHGHDVAIYDHNGVPIDHIYSLGSTGHSVGIAFRASTGNASRLYLSNADNNKVTIYRSPSPGAPAITNESMVQTGKTTATLNTAIVPFSHGASCVMQYVDDATFQASGYANATSVRCTPSNVGSSFTYQTASANVSGLTAGTTYHFRVIATSAAGSTTGVDQTWQQTFGWAPFDRCPVDDPAMLAVDGVTASAFCVASSSTNGVITIGNITTAVGDTNLQFGAILNFSDDTTTAVSPAAGALRSDPVQIPSLGVTATVEDAGAPSNFNLFAGLQIGVPIITLPIKIHLESTSLPLGPSCFLGSDQNPIVLHPENTDLSNSGISQVTFDASGAPVELQNAHIDTTTVSGEVQGDNSFSVPGASGCGPNGDGTLDGAVDAVAGVPSPAGDNMLVLANASSSLTGELNPSGQQLAHDWHIGFG